MRFKEFEGEWEDITLGKCANSLDYGMNSSAIKFDGKNRYIRITDIDENTSKYKSENPVSPEGELTDKYLVRENDILFTRTGASTGKTYCYDIRDGKLYFAGFLIRAKIKEIYNVHFIFAQTQTTKYDKWVKLMSMRSGQPGINSQEYSSYPLSIPSKFEQDKVSTVLGKINERILAQNKIIEHLESLSRELVTKILAQEIKFQNNKSVDFPIWESMLGNEIFANISNKKHNSDLPILAITQEYGGDFAEIDHPVSV
ncbi:restriction endonuclease subunit S [Pedobacter mucosus]|uniref:restriction endonuclease subunit S n=1 Tax=Pedobacter mucosus TaxID=2895286 RepID=UPI001EE4B6F6|nr:restriction endonuclease subunit S [Pedobacter mucosus]UKT62705.1 restriction endonuclease subunit S [Pedobacter mucosus]